MRSFCLGLKSTTILTITVASSFLWTSAAFSLEADFRLQLDFDSSSSGTNTEDIQSIPGQPATTARDWVFSQSDPKFTMIFMDDLSFPVQIVGAEHVLTSATKGVVKIQSGKVTSVTRTPLDVVTTPGLVYRSARPILFVSIPGFDMHNGTDAWQSTLSYKLSTLINSSQYKHFLVDWESAAPLQRQAHNVADFLKEFLRTKQVPWDVVLIGHSRGGIFAHEVAERLSGFDKVSKLHVMLLDATAATAIGDVYPTTLPPGAFGYMKYDGLPYFDGGTIGTRSDLTISGYTNYGANNFQANIANTTNPGDSHSQYPGAWLANTGVHGFGVALQNILALRDNSGGPFLTQGDSGAEALLSRVATVDAFADSVCDSTSCTFDGYFTLGPSATVGIGGMVGITGVDVAVSTAFASASTVIRRDQVELSHTTLFTSQSSRIDAQGITVGTSILNGYDQVQVELGLTRIEGAISIGRINVPLLSLSPLDALFPGGSLAKKLWKKLF